MPNNEGGAGQWLRCAAWGAFFWLLMWAWGNVRYEQGQRDCVRDMRARLEKVVAAKRLAAGLETLNAPSDER